MGARKETSGMPGTGVVVKWGGGEPLSTGTRLLCGACGGQREGGWWALGLLDGEVMVGREIQSDPCTGLGKPENLGVNRREDTAGHPEWWVDPCVVCVCVCVCVCKPPCLSSPPCHLRAGTHFTDEMSTEVGELQGWSGPTRSLDVDKGIF